MCLNGNDITKNESVEQRVLVLKLDTSGSDFPWLFTSYVTLSKLLNLSEPQTVHCKEEGNSVSQA